MSGMGVAALMLGVGMAASSFSTNASHGADEAPIDPEVLAVREAAWRAFFGGDVKTLGELLPQEFTGIGMNDGPFTDLAATLEASRAFRERGGRLVRLAFPETQAQVFGDVVVLYGRYEVVVFTGGAERTMRGRLTELFVKRNGKWLHPGWHLDLLQGPAAP
jgi:hypothetical protein